MAVIRIFLVGRHLQLNYANPELQRAGIDELIAIAVR
jgi:hypothetical protein